MSEKVDWDLSFADESKFEEEKKEVEDANKKFVEKWKSRNDYLESAEVLKEALDDYEKLQKSVGFGGKELYFYHLKFYQNQLDLKTKSKFNKIQDFANELINESLFFLLNLAKISKEKQEGFLKFELLKDYKHFLEIIFKQSEFLLSDKEEKILLLKEKVAHDNWQNLVQGLLSKNEKNVLTESGKKEKKSFAEILNLINNQNKEIRDSAALAVNEILDDLSDVAEGELNSILENKKINDNLRGFDRADLSRHLEDDIDSGVVDSLISAVSLKFDISKRHYKLKAKLMGVDSMEYHERNVPYSNIKINYDFDKGFGKIKNVFAKLDSDFLQIAEGYLKNGQIDVFPKKGKIGGAYCFHGLLSDKTFILLNYGGLLDDLTTIAHEIGHGINNEFMKKKQNALNFGTPKSTAEVASIFMEDFVLGEELESVGEEEKLSIMVQKLDRDVSTIFRQIACYVFEQELHKEFRKKGYLSKEEIGKLFSKYMAAYMGEGVKMSEGSENWWIYWNHIREMFYNYSYASGCLISKALQKKVKEDKAFIENVKFFLSIGTSMSPKDIFLKLGLDISDKDFWNQGLSEVEELLNKTEKLAKKLGKI